MENIKLKTRRQIAQELKISKSTLYRKMKKANLTFEGNLLNEHQVQKIKRLFQPEESKSIAIESKTQT